MNSFLNPVDLSIASKALRLANYLIDVIAFLIFFIIIFIVVTLFGVDMELFFAENPFIDRILSAVMYFLFMSLQEIIFKGRSLGKFLTGTVAVNENGEPMDVQKTFIRNLCRLIPFDGFSFLGTLGWHDKVSKTRVVMKKEFEKHQLDTNSIDQIGAEPRLHD